MALIAKVGFLLAACWAAYGARMSLVQMPSRWRCGGTTTSGNSLIALIWNGDPFVATAA